MAFANELAVASAAAERAGALIMRDYEARKAMADIHAQSQTGERAPKHTYSLGDYGLSVETVKERFAGL